MALQGRGLQAVTPPQQHRIVQVELVRQVLGGNALREAAQDHHDGRAVVANAGKDRAGEHARDRAAFAAAVADHRGALPAGVRGFLRL